MPIEHIAIQGLWPLLRKIPSAVGFLARGYFTRERLASLVYVDLFPRHESARVDLAEVATFQFCLQAINLSPFELELDRARFQLSCGGVQLEGAILNKERIASGASTNLFFSGAIQDGQANQIWKFREENSVSLSGNIEFNCVARQFSKRIMHLDGVKLSVINGQHRNANA
ncbi:hypothetical protein [Uliginosibacterium sp. TH139]|uniref:hypothetical protein n=1 Tax=Uliginosibacterium sp. TH139 TaxID=2067453 RepID=UPI0011815AAB|nr:hypothetical protein [Uliginosibacterium sp. TH139]